MFNWIKQPLHYTQIAHNARKNIKTKNARKNIKTKNARKNIKTKAKVKSK